MSPIESKSELRCFCARKPLLAVYGIDKYGDLYVHVKVHRQTRIICEIISISGTMKIHCRECLRWHTVTIVEPDKAKLVETVEPDILRSSTRQT